MLHPEIKVLSIGLILLTVRLPFLNAEDEFSEEKTSVPIIRQINKVNDDGTYTYGYEAADGTFKIETRDVLGNIKGMFGFIDESGELKRVSYTANNETGFHNSIVHTPVLTQIRPMAGSSARRPVLILKNTPALHSPTKGPVIQHIPKKTQKDEEESQTTSSDYVNGRRFSPAEKNDTSEEHGDDSAKSHNSNPLRKILVSKRPIEEKDTRGKGGNNLRRQLNRALDLRGEMTHVYAGGDNGFSPNLPPHLSALMSELRPIQVVRASSPESIGYETVDVESSSQEVNEVPATTTELPYGSRKFGPPLAFVNPRYRRPVPPPPEESPYGQEPPIPYRHSNIPPPQQGVGPISSPLGIPLNIPNPNYQTQPHYYEHQAVPVIPSILRDEIMAIIYNYLQARLGPNSQNPYYPRYPYPSYTNPLFTPNYPYAPVNYGLPPYVNPYVNTLPQYYPPYTNPNALYPVPTQTPLNHPNIQFSPRTEPPQRIGPHRLQTARAAATDDADLLQMLLASPTRVPISQLKYSPTAERLNRPKPGGPVRNLQIITETTESRPVTTESPE